MEYLDDATRSAIQRTIAEAGAKATPEAPVARLGTVKSARDDVDGELRLTVWPGGTPRTLALLDPYARDIQWCEAAA
jgi:hypothetical protein